jgi:aryl-alcohol dehydrogenase-like predicted oxidoreductase
MKYKFLGRTGLKVSIFGFGNWLNSVKEEDYKITKDCIELCLKGGVNFFDTA